MEAMSDTLLSDEENRDSEFREPTDPWSVPIFRFGGRTVTVSYSVFLVAAVVLGVALNEALSGSGQDVAAATAIGVVFWISGWAIQSFSYASIARLIGSPIRHLSIGPFGIKAFARMWSPSGALAVSLGTIASLVALGSLYRLVEGGFQVPGLGSEPESLWTMPSLGMTKNDSPWLAGAWLCWIQAIFQLFPLGGSLGRQLLGSLIGLSAKHSGVDFRIRILRRSLTVIAIATVGIAIRLYFNRTFPGWLIMLGIGVSIWISTRGKDTTETFRGFQRHADKIGPTGLRATAKELVRTHQGRRRSQKTLQREREEAADASRLDEVLHRLHDSGADSLSREDRELLQRVSLRVRQERDADSSSG